MLYFIEELHSANQETLKKHGLDRLLPNNFSTRECGKGPGNKRGIAVGDPEFGKILYNDANQSWSPRFGFPGTYVGVNCNPVTPAQLARDKQVSGPMVELLDGNKWMVPQLREWREGDAEIPFVYECKLPTVLKQSPTTGAFVSGPVTPSYRELWEESLAISEDMAKRSKNSRYEIDSDRLDRFVAGLLSVNYRVSAAEIGLLGLIDVNLYRDIIWAALDWGTLMELAKNAEGRAKESGQELQTIGSSNGPTPVIADSQATTDQP